MSKEKGDPLHTGLISLEPERKELSDICTVWNPNQYREQGNLTSEFSVL